MKLTKENPTEDHDDFVLWYESNMVRKDRQYWLEVKTAWSNEKELRDFYNKIVQNQKLREFIDDTNFKLIIDDLRNEQEMCFTTLRRDVIMRWEKIQELLEESKK